MEGRRSIMRRTKLFGAAALGALLTSGAFADDVEERAMDLRDQATPVLCDSDAPQAEASLACTDAKTALGRSITPSKATAPPESGTPARAALDSGSAPAAGAVAATPQPAAPDAPDTWPALLP
jgi:hypothetical protein